MDENGVIWDEEPSKHDYPAAAAYLSLCIADEVRVAEIVEDLRRSEITVRRANDLLRASGLPLLPRTNPQVERVIVRVHQGRRLSPVLLVVDDDLAHPLVIADGYHRIVAGYYLDEKTNIPCRIARVT